MSDVYLSQPVRLSGDRRDRFQFADRADPDLDVTRETHGLAVRAGMALADGVYHRAAGRGRLLARQAARRARDEAFAASPPVPPEKREALAKLADVLLQQEALQAAADKAQHEYDRAKERAWDDPRPYLDAARRANTELHTVREWVGRIRAKIAEFDHDPRQDDYRRRWRQHADRAAGTLADRRAELRANVRAFLLAAAAELVELDAAAEALGSREPPTPCDPADMPEGYLAPGSDPDPAADEAGEHEPAPAGEHATADADEPAESAAADSAPEDAGDEPADEHEPEPEPGSPAADARRAKVLALHAAGKSGRAIAKELGLHQTQVQRILKAAEPGPVVQTATPVHRGDTGPTKWVRAEAPELS